MPPNKRATAILREIKINLDSLSKNFDLLNELKVCQTEEDLRQNGLQILKNILVQFRPKIETAVKQDPLCSHQAIKIYSSLTDVIIKLALKIVIRFFHPLANPTKSEKICLVAVGGYGRKEMAPFSDIDLLFLTPYKQTAWGESVIESVLYILWDLKFKVGYSVRTIDDCLRLGNIDFTIRTNLLENRFLAGEESLQKKLKLSLWNKLFKNSGSEFVEAKLLERSERHEKQGKIRYTLEPNVKEGKGGLRDLQTLYWITKYLYRIDSPDQFVDTGVFTQDEFLIFQKAEIFLWAVRCSLHLISNRAGEQLNFNAQVELAERFGFKDTSGMRGVEKFMQLYFIHAKNVGDLTRIFLTSLESIHVKTRPTIGVQIRNLFELGFAFNRETIPKQFSIDNGRLTVTNKIEFLKQPINLIKLFQVSLRSQLLIHPNALRIVAGNLHLIDHGFRIKTEANEIFLDLLLNYQNPEKALRHMNEVGFLGAFIPEFGRIVAMMQFNVYHSYTVDEHTIQCICNLSEIEHKNLVEDLPIASEILAGDINRKVLYIALLLHDIGKGLPDDHSVSGAKIAKKISPRLGLKPEETEFVEWLVRNHLLMSDVAQKRDITDSRTIQNFANQVTSTAKLKLLTVLTVCDIRGVGPNSWNNWKAVLLRDLYKQTSAILSQGSLSSSKPERIIESKEKVSSALKHWKKEDLKKETDRHYDSFWLGLETNTQITFLDLLSQISDQIISVKIDTDKSRDANRICCVMQDHPGIFARLSGALALQGSNVVDARTYTSRDGFATAVFWIQNSENSPFENQYLIKLEKTIKRSLKGELIPKKELESKEKFKKTERNFRVPTTITFDNLGSDLYTIIEIDTRDRIGLLHDLANTLYRNNISIFTAIIATYGAQAVDTFYVKDIFGLKLHSKSKQEHILRKLREAIELGSEKAMR